jgi:serine/threonine-protein kinase
MMNDVVGERRTIIMPGRRGGTRATGAVRVGDRLGKYRLCLELGSGGMSTVYLARVVGGVGRHRFVALKVMRPQLANDPDLLAMFVDEAKLASVIHHPNVCDVIDYHVGGPATYLVMEMLVGESLSALRRQVAAHPEVLPPALYAGVIARIIADAAEGLHAAHELTDGRGRPLHVVHRDISPENVFITYDGHVKIMDFGVALTAQQHHVTQPGTVRGKYGYLQPEVLHGGKPDRRADIWGLGVVAWELLTLQRLFDGDDAVELMRDIAEMDIPPPSSVRRELPPAIDEVVMKALERDPARRYQTAREMARKLTCFLANERLPIGLASLADLCDRAFADGRACARAQLATIDGMDDITETSPEPDSVTVAYATDAEISRSLPIVVTQDASGQSRMVALAPEPTPTAPPPSTWPRWMPFAVSLAAGTLAAVFGLLLLHSCAEPSHAPPPPAALCP